MSDTEQVVSDLLRSLHDVDRALATRRHELTRQDDWSEVTHTLDISELSIGEKAHLSFSGYLDGERKDVGGIGWIFELIRSGDGWVVERSLVLNANDKDYQEVVAGLPTVECERTAELAASLPSLLDELLRLPPPDPS
jgi:hypothetical protein